MQNVKGRNLTAEDVGEIRDFADSARSQVVRDFLLEVAEKASLRNDVFAVDEPKTYSPAEAASKIGMSRTHLYKLLDRGELPFHRLGTHRKINARDLEEFEKQRHADRSELAEKFVHHREKTAALDSKFADLP